MSWRDSPAEQQAERDRMPYIQIDTDTWVVMREDKDRPKAVIERVKWRDDSEQYLLKTWHSDPSQRRLVRIHESVEEANRSVKWRNNHKTGRENHSWGTQPGVRSHQPPPAITPAE